MKRTPAVPASLTSAFDFRRIRKSRNEQKKTTQLNSPTHFVDKPGDIIQRPIQNSLSNTINQSNGINVEHNSRTLSLSSSTFPNANLFMNVLPNSKMQTEQRLINDQIIAQSESETLVHHKDINNPSDRKIDARIASKENKISPHGTVELSPGKVSMQCAHFSFITTYS